MPLRKMKWRASRGLTFGSRGSNAPSGLNPGTRLAAFPRGHWAEAGVRGEEPGGLGGWVYVCLGFGITANHRGIKMFTGRGGISSELMIFNVIIFAPVSRAHSVWTLWALWNEETRMLRLAMKCVCAFLYYCTFIVLSLSIYGSRSHMGSLEKLLN